MRHYAGFSKIGSQIAKLKISAYTVLEFRYIFDTIKKLCQTTSYGTVMYHEQVGILILYLKPRHCKYYTLSNIWSRS